MILSFEYLKANIAKMPSLSSLVKTSISLSTLGRSVPESISFTSSSSVQLLGYFGGWNATLHVCGCNERVDGIVPMTVFSVPENITTCSWVKDKVTSYLTADDVFETDFLQTVYLQGPTTYEAGLLDCLKEAYGTSAIFAAAGTATFHAATSAEVVPNGPYLVYMEDATLTLGPVYRIYHDELQAFMSGILENGTTGQYRYAPVNTVSDATVGIPVPSRLYAASTKDSAKPLNGLRVTVKDIIDINGVKTSNGNRAWFKIYPAVNATAATVQKVVDLGAALIGKTKTAQFANADRVTADWVDYHDSFNPRGDGYQDTGVSSAGAGSATAGYDWVDVSICTDTGGSVRIPASKQGVFALRPSFGATSNEGVMLEGEYFDAVGYHTRSPYMLQEFGKTWLADSPLNLTSYSGFPKKLIVSSTLWPVTNKAAQPVFDAWIERLSTFLNGTIDTTSVDTYWNTTATKPGTEFFSYMQQVAFNLNWPNQIAKVIKPWQKDYAALEDGRTPFINPFPQARFDSAVNVTQADINESYDRFTYFKDWFGAKVMQPDLETCSKSLFLIPMFAADPVYRNNVYSQPNVGSWSSFLMYYYSVQSQGPEVVFPIGQAPYNSNITNVEEQLPVTIDIVAHRGCDYMLLDLAKALADAGLLQTVKTGRTAF